jgi:hypothetical protein
MFLEVQFSFIGTEADVKFGAEISLELDFVQNYCGQTSLSELLVILVKSKILFGNDSGSMHLMSALPFLAQPLPTGLHQSILMRLYLAAIYPPHPVFQKLVVLLTITA